MKSSCLVPRSKRADRIVGDRGQRRNVGQRLSVGSPEAQLTISLLLEVISVLMDGAVMTPTQHREVRERRRATLGPVTDVMRLSETHAAAWKPAALVAVLQRAANRRWNC